MLAKTTITENPYNFGGSSPFEALISNLAHTQPDACYDLSQYKERQRLRAMAGQAEQIAEQALEAAEALGEALSVASASGELADTAAMDAGWSIKFLVQMSRTMRNFGSWIDVELAGGMEEWDRKKKAEEAAAG